MTLANRLAMAGRHFLTMESCPGQCRRACMCNPTRRPGHTGMAGGRWATNACSSAAAGDERRCRKLLREMATRALPQARRIKSHAKTRHRLTIG